MSRAAKLTALTALALITVLGLIGCSKMSDSNAPAGANVQAEVDSREIDHFH